MQLTEKYTIFLARPSGLTQESIEGILLYLIKTYYEQTGYFIQTIIDHSYLICNEDIGCKDDNIVRCIKITCTRNPTFQPDSLLYQQVIMYIFTSIRRAYPYVSAIIEKQTVDMGFYYPIHEHDYKEEVN